MVSTLRSNSSSRYLVWLVIFGAVWLALGFAPIALVAMGNIGLGAVDASQTQVAGTIGDAFGLSNSFFSAAALLFVGWSIRLQQSQLTESRAEWRHHARAVENEAALMREATTLAAVNHIYRHFRPDGAGEDLHGLLAALASGHRRWAIRESFRAIGGDLGHEWNARSVADAIHLVELMTAGRGGGAGLCEIAKLTASLVVDPALPAEFRAALWRVYDVIESDPDAVAGASGEAHDEFWAAAGSLCRAYPDASYLPATTHASVPSPS